jgi:hypothetical protein
VEHLVEKLLAQKHPELGTIHVLVKVQNQIVRHYIVGRSEESDETLDEVGLFRVELVTDMFVIDREIELVGGPNVLERVFIELEKLRVLHGTKS